MNFLFTTSIKHKVPHHVVRLEHKNLKKSAHSKGFVIPFYFIPFYKYMGPRWHSG